MLKPKSVTIKDKLTLIIMLTCIGTLLLAGSMFMLWEWTSLRRNMVQDLSTHAEMIADNCNVALASNNAEDAEPILSSLRVKSSVVLGCIRTKTGEPFAGYYRDGFNKDIHLCEAREDGYSFGDGALTVFKTIVLDGEKIGRVCLRSDLNPIYVMLRRNATIIIVVLAFCSLAGYFVSLKLQRIISGPILSLAKLAKTVSEKKDYSVRVTKHSKDEVGVLTNAFNEMLERIHQRDLALVGANEKMETRARERTAKLTTEIAERKKGEQEIKQLAKFPSDNPNPVLRIAKDGTIIYTNSASSPVLKSWQRRQGQPVPELYYKQIKEVLSSGKVSGFEFNCDNRVFLITLAPVAESGYVNLYGLDITERKKAEQTLENLNEELEATILELSYSNRELSDFAHVVAHDLKTPLRAIGTLADWLSTSYADKFDQEGKEQVKLLVGRAVRINELIDSILQYSEVGRTKQRTEKVNLNTLLTEIISIIDPPENIEITVENRLPTIICEKVHMMQLFQNLLINAVKHTDKPQGHIKVGCVEHDGLWEFSVADNGPGIEEKYFEKIFKMFQTLSLRDELESTGIGLTMAKKIVETYGGEIWIESEVGIGSTFFFTLPR